jgi:hypothetical protein
MVNWSTLRSTARNGRENTHPQRLQLVSLRLMRPGTFLAACSRTAVRASQHDRAALPHAPGTAHFYLRSPPERPHFSALEVERLVGAERPAAAVRLRDVWRRSALAQRLDDEAPATALRPPARSAAARLPADRAPYLHSPGRRKNTPIHARSSPKPKGCTWCYLASRIGHMVPIWQPLIGSSIH